MSAKVIQHPSGSDGYLYLFPMGEQVAVSRHIHCESTYNKQQVEAAALKVFRNAVAAGKPTDDVTLNSDQYKRFLVGML